MAVDDHPLLREGVAALLEAQPDIQLVGSAANGAEAIDQHRALRPDVVLMDLQMPEMGGIEAIQAIRNEAPKARFIVLTTYEGDVQAVRALKAGAAGYMLKDVSRQELLTTVRRVLRGESILNAEVATRTLQRLASEAPSQAASPLERLTARERQVLRLLAEGRTNREIAAHLSLSIGTVKIHVEHIIAKLGVSDRTQAAVRAVASGLLQATTP